MVRRACGMTLLAATLMFAGGAVGGCTRAQQVVTAEQHRTSSTSASVTSSTATASSSSIVSGHSAIVRVTLAQDGALGNLSEVLAKRSDFASSLASSLASPVIRGQDNGDGLLVVASFRVVGSTARGKELHLFAHELREGFDFRGGRLTEWGGMSAPVRIRLSGSTLACLGIDLPEDGEGFGSSLDRMMPQWAANRALSDPTAAEVQAVRDVAGVWARPMIARTPLVQLPRPTWTDPHRHVPDIYGLGALPQAVTGISVRVVPPPRSTDDTPGLGDLERESISPDKRYECFSPLTAWNGLVVHDKRTGQWMHVDGPGLDITIDRIAWASGMLCFDKVDVGFSEPRPKATTGVHVEIDLAKHTVDRVVPIGPYTANWKGP